MSLDLKQFKERLTKERAQLEAELSSVARKDPENPLNWEPVSADRDASQADENTLADSIEDYEENTAITNSLEARYRDVVSALDKIEHKTFGKCQICDKEIETDRLEANPAARTCKEHLNSI